MAVGGRSLLAFWAGGAGKPVTTVKGVRSLAAPWVGGAGKTNPASQGRRSLAAFWVGGAASQKFVAKVSATFVARNPNAYSTGGARPPKQSISLSARNPTALHKVPIYDIGSTDFGYFNPWTSSGSGSVGQKSTTINSTIALLLTASSTKYRGRTQTSNLGLILNESAQAVKSATKISSLNTLLGLTSTATSGLNQSRFVNSTIPLLLNLTSDVSIYKFFDTGSSRYLRGSRRLSKSSERYSRG